MESWKKIFDDNIMKDEFFTAKVNFKKLVRLKNNVF